MANLSPELLNRLAAYFNSPVDPNTGNGPPPAYTDPETGLVYARGNQLSGPLGQAYYSSPMGRAPKTPVDLYRNDGTFSERRQIDDDHPFWASNEFGQLIALAAIGGAGGLTAMGAGAGAAAAPAAAADFTMGGVGGATAFTPATAAEMAGMGLGGASEFAIPAGVAFNPATAAEMASMGLGDAAGATATMGAGAAPATFNAAADSQLANAAIEQAGGSALNTTIPSVTVNGAPTGGFMSSLGSAASNLFGGNSGTNTIGGGFDWTKLIGPALNAAGGIAGANAASSAADAQLQAAREAAALNEPFRQAGMQGMNRLTDLLGVSGRTGAEGYGSAARQFGMADFQADPGAEFRRQQGEQGLQRAASASGGLGSGKYLKDAMTFNSGLASQEYNNSFNRFQTNRASVLNPLQSLMGAGQTAANTIGEYGTQGANAQAAGKVGQANAYTNAITQGMGMYQNQQQQNQNQLFQNALMNRWTNGG